MQLPVEVQACTDMCLLQLMAATAIKFEQKGVYEKTIVCVMYGGGSMCGIGNMAAPTYLC